MQKRVMMWGTFAGFLLGLWLLIAIWAIREGGAKEKKEPDFDPSIFEKFKHGMPEPDEP
jgi:hypothetical protein